MKDYKRLTDRVIAEMLRNTEEESWDSDNPEAQCYIRLADLEDKIESGELVEVPKGAVVLTPEERAEEMRLCNEERKQAVKEFAERLKQYEEPVKIGNEWKAVVRDVDIERIAAEMRQEVK